MRSFGPVLVTGASTGIGRAITEMLADNGHVVYATARSKDALQELAQIPNVVSMKLDVRREDDVKRTAEEVGRRSEGLYGLVNNAGIGRAWPVAEETACDLHDVFDVNVVGSHRMVRALLPFIVKSKGRIVNISSVSGFGVTMYLGSYQMTKHALEVYSDSLALNLRRYGVKVSVIEPGNFETDIWKRSIEMTQRLAKSHRPVLMRKEIQELLRNQRKDLEDSLKYSTPEPVAESVMDALFSRHPKRRYMVATSKEDTDWAIKALILKLVQANYGSSFPLSRKEMHAWLDRMWKEESS